MEMIKDLQINNYKSISQLNLNCSRINVLIGEPNVGKSNILEALDLSYLSWLMGRNHSQKKGIERINIKEYFRVNAAADLFHLGDLSKSISVMHQGFSYDTLLKFNNENQTSIFELSALNGGAPTKFDNDFKPVNNAQYFSSPIHPYRYKNNIQFHDTGNYLNILMPPYGNNLPEVIQRNPSIEDFITVITKDYGFELNKDLASHKLSIQLRISAGLVYSIPWIALADTFKRFLFYIAAIRYNNAHVITLEEPDAHSFPKYVSFLADEIIRNNNRQFFIATHSPYLLNNLIENTPEGQLAVFVCGYDKNDFKTIARRLSTEDLSEILDYGVDIFFNINRYLDERITHHS